jgi:hypothetical protein
MKQLSVLITVMIVAITSCVKQDFDAPPPSNTVDPNLTTQGTIADLRAKYTTGNPSLTANPKTILGDTTISGIVVADDKSGSFYKQIVIQDGTAGITINLDAYSLYNDYPIGRKIYVKCKGLTIGADNKMVTLGLGIDSSNGPQIPGRIPQALIPQYIVKGPEGQSYTARTVTIAQLNDTYQSQLIKIENAEVAAADLGKTYSVSSTVSSGANRTIKPCTGGSITLRNSAYAKFWNYIMPSGNGTMTAIYTVYGNTKQLIIRDTFDMPLYGPRCGTGPTTVMNISDVRALYTGTTTAAPNGKRITGVVISDRTTSNINGQNIVIQQGNGLAGILVRFDAAHSFNIGDSLDINISLQELSTFNGLLQLNNVPLSYATRVATGKVITPRTATIAEINTNYTSWESTLVKIVNVNLSGGGTYSGSVSLNDGSGTLTMFTSSLATFATQTYPPTAASVTGYLSIFNTTKQLSLRNPGGTLNDVVAGGGGGGGGTGLALTTSPYTQNFNNIGSGSLPQGVFVKIGASASSLGTGDMPQFGSGLGTPTAWNNTSAGLKNFASATGLSATDVQATQDASTNRALGIRQTSAAGYDPGAAYLLLLDNTTGKSNFQLSFLLQSLDNSVGRTTTWTVDYGFGDAPTSFTAVATTPATLTTGPTWGSTPVSVNFGAALNNQNQKVWIRIVALGATTGSGSRASTALDDVQLTWN